MAAVNVPVKGLTGLITIFAYADDAVTTIADVLASIVAADGITAGYYYNLALESGNKLEISDSVRLYCYLKKCYMLRQNHQIREAMQMAAKVINEVYNCIGEQEPCKNHKLLKECLIEWGHECKQNKKDNWMENETTVSLELNKKS